jgi:hypothetical protein
MMKAEATKPASEKLELLRDATVCGSHIREYAGSGKIGS